MIVFVTLWQHSLRLQLFHRFITSMSVADDTYTPVNEITTDNLYHVHSKAGMICHPLLPAPVAEGDYFDITRHDKGQFTEAHCKKHTMKESSRLKLKI